MEEIKGRDIAIMINLGQGNPDVMTNLNLNLVGKGGEKVKLIVTPRTLFVETKEEEKERRKGNMRSGL